MDIAVKAAEGKAESARREVLRSMRKAKMHLPPGWQRKRLKNIIKEEVEYMWREKSRKNFRKKNHLEAQHKPRKEVDVFEGIAISEKEFLKLPKSATDFVEINEETVNTNIQVMALREQEDNTGGMDAEGLEAVLEGRRVYNRQDGSVDLRKMRATDMPTCKRTTVPNAAEASKGPKSKY